MSTCAVLVYMGVLVPQCLALLNRLPDRLFCVCVWRLHQNHVLFAISFRWNLKSLSHLQGVLLEISTQIKLLLFPASAVTTVQLLLDSVLGARDFFCFVFVHKHVLLLTIIVWRGIVLIVILDGIMLFFFFPSSMEYSELIDCLLLSAPWTFVSRCFPWPVQLPGCCKASVWSWHCITSWNAELKTLINQWKWTRNKEWMAWPCQSSPLAMACFKNVPTGPTCKA